MTMADRSDIHQNNADSIHGHPVKRLTSSDRFAWNAAENRIFMEFRQRTRWETDPDIQPLLASLNLDQYRDVFTRSGSSVDFMVRKKVNDKLRRTYVMPNDPPARERQPHLSPPGDAPNAPHHSAKDQIVHHRQSRDGGRQSLQAWETQLRAQEEKLDILSRLNGEESARLKEQRAGLVSDRERHVQAQSRLTEKRNRFLQAKAQHLEERTWLIAETERLDRQRDRFMDERARFEEEKDQLADERELFMREKAQQMEERTRLATEAAELDRARSQIKEDGNTEGQVNLKADMNKVAEERRQLTHDLERLQEREQRFKEEQGNVGEAIALKAELRAKDRLIEELQEKNAESIEPAEESDTEEPQVGVTA